MVIPINPNGENIDVSICCYIGCSRDDCTRSKQGGSRR